jgi:hypothetical protein
VGNSKLAHRVASGLTCRASRCGSSATKKRPIIPDVDRSLNRPGAASILSLLRFGINQQMVTRSVSEGRSQVFGIPRSRSHASGYDTTSQPQFSAATKHSCESHGRIASVALSFHSPNSEIPTTRKPNSLETTPTRLGLGHPGVLFR